MSKLGDVMRECLDPDRYVGPLPPGLREDMRAALDRIAELEGEPICRCTGDGHKPDCAFWLSLEVR